MGLELPDTDDYSHYVKCGIGILLVYVYSILKEWFGRSCWHSLNKKQYLFFFFFFFVNLKLIDVVWSVSFLCPPGKLQVSKLIKMSSTLFVAVLSIWHLSTLCLIERKENERELIFSFWINDVILFIQEQTNICYKKYICIQLAMIKNLYIQSKLQLFKHIYQLIDPNFLLTFYLHH